MFDLVYCCIILIAMRYFLLFLLQFVCFFADAQLNMTLLSHVDYNPTHNSGCSNLWGYTDELGNEYAIVGLNKGTSIVDVTDPVNPVEKFFLADSNSIWREVKVWGDYAYITTEEHAGLLIIDLSPLPASTVLPNYRFFGDISNPFSSAHSLFIDENGILYIHGANRGNGGVIFFDLSVDPINPPEVGSYDAHYVHDSYARGDTLYTANIVDGFFTVLDISDKSNPIVLATQNTPNNFTHNTWLSDDGKYLFTTDEVSNASIASYDITDMGDIKLLDQVKSNPGSGSIPHNVYYYQGWLVTSYYRDGVVIHDAHDPYNLVEVGNIDVSPLSGNGFNSIWGVYPYFNSGTIIASDIENGLYVFGRTLVRGAMLHGTVTNFSDGSPIFNATISILNQSVNTSSDLAGNYRTGLGQSGVFDIAFSKPGFFPDTLFNVSITNGDTTFANMALVPFTPISVSGQITEAGSGIPIAGAQVVFKNNDFTFSAISDASGNYSIPSMYQGQYNQVCGHWGHWNNCDLVDFQSSVNTRNIPLEKGYYDDFALDFGWTVFSGADGGNWVREIPIPAGLPDGTPSNPHYDVLSDCDLICFQTGNQAGTAATADVDGGPTILTSPVFDATQYSDPWIGYERWFFNYVGQGPPNDTLKIMLTDGIDTVIAESITVDNTPTSQWVSSGFQISAFMVPSPSMQIIFYTEDDWNMGANYLEAAVDRFYISEGNQLGLAEQAQENMSWKSYPNPSNGFIHFWFDDVKSSSHQVKIFDLSGKCLKNLNIPFSGYGIQLDLSPGIYFLTSENYPTIKLIISE